MNGIPVNGGSGSLVNCMSGSLFLHPANQIPLVAAQPNKFTEVYMVD